MATALDIITSAMRKARILTKSETPDGDESSDALVTLNELLDSWSLESLMIVSRTEEDFTLTGGTGDYTIGSGGTFNTTRPNLIAAAYTQSGTTDYALKIMDDETYAKITQKAIQSDLPLYLNYTNAYPLGTVRLWPVPASALTLTLLSEKPITNLASLATTVDLTPGWNRALVSNLALELIGEYGQEATADLVRIAKQSKAAIRKAIAKNRTMDVPALLDNFNTIYTGYYT